MWLTSSYCCEQGIFHHNAISEFNFSAKVELPEEMVEGFGKLSWIERIKHTLHILRMNSGSTKHLAHWAVKVENNLSEGKGSFEEWKISRERHKMLPLACDFRRSQTPRQAEKKRTYSPQDMLQPFGQSGPQEQT